MSCLRAAGFIHEQRWLVRPLCERVRVHDPTVWTPQDAPVLPVPALNWPSCKTGNSRFTLSLQVWPGAAITVPLPRATQENQLRYRSLPAGPRGPPPSWKYTELLHNFFQHRSLLCYRESPRQAGDPLVDWDVGRKRKILVLRKDRRMTMFCLTDYDRLEILSVHRKIREGNQTTRESTALWAEHPNGSEEILVGLSALLPLSSVRLRHSPSHGPFPFSFQ